MSLHSIEKVQVLETSLAEAWDFFSSPLNLGSITPPDMNFKILSDFKPGDKIYAGMLIHYQVSPLFGIPLNWTTEITAAVHNRYFIDEQRRGPFAYWHHEHFFEAVPEGVKMTDKVQWKVHGWFLGDIVNSIIVEKRVQEIFAFRKTKMQSLFGRQPVSV